jgi:hypothetical protein
VRLDNGKAVQLDPAQAKHIEHGYAVDGSHPVTADRVIFTQDAMPQLNDKSAALAAFTRASRDLAIYTSDASGLNHTRRDRSATVEHAPHFEAGIEVAAQKAERRSTPSEQDRHYAPLHNALSTSDAQQFQWKAETSTIETYQHTETFRNIHIDAATGQFHDQDRNPMSQGAALDHAMPQGREHSQVHNPLTNVLTSVLNEDQHEFDNSQGLGL